VGGKGGILPKKLRLISPDVVFPRYPDGADAQMKETRTNFGFKGENKNADVRGLWFLCGLFL